ncbi:MAG TPA: tetratricopeptide repeat protein [Acidobacteriaceae bacterium]|nr:tetratricopeptide repeat protein [Acidobacteriaceae bacterium]
MQFADFEVDFRTGELRRRGILIPIQGKPLSVLAILVERPGELVSREDLYKALWDGQTFVDYDKNLGVAVAKLREVLEDSPLRPLFIETIPRRGYRFVGSLLPGPAVASKPAVPEQATAQPASRSDAPTVSARFSQDAPSLKFTLDGAAEFDSLNPRRHRLPRTMWAGGIAAAIVILASLYFRSRVQGGNIVYPATALPRVNPEAQQDYLKAKEFSERWIVGDLKSALIFDDRAIAIEPTYAPAFSLRASVLKRLGEMGVIESEQACRRARADALHAIDLDPHLASGYVSLADIQMNHDWDLVGAEASLAKARRIAPNDVSTLAALGVLRRSRGQLDESIALQRQVIALSPLNGASYASLAVRLFAAGKLDEALAAHRRALDLDPQLEYVHLNRAEILLAKGFPTEALKEVELEPGEVWRQLGEVLVLYDLGRTAESDAALQQLIATHPAEHYTIASAYAYRGEIDEAFTWLDRAFAQRDVGLMEIGTDPLFRKLHVDPRFAALTLRMKTPL